MKKKIFMIVTLISVLMICSVVYAASINKTNISIYEGKGYTLKLSGTKIRSVSTENKKIATISKSGYVKGVKAGTTKVSLRGTNGKTYKCSVKVVAPCITKKSVSVYTGKTITVGLKGTTIKSVATANSKVATINKNGVITGKNAGSTYVHVKGTNNKIYKCTVKVVAPYINKSKISIGETKSYQLKLYGDTIVKTSIKDENVATISNNGLVKGVTKGDTVATITGKSGRTYICNVNLDDVYVVNDFAEYIGPTNYKWGSSIKGEEPEYFKPILHNANVVKFEEIRKYMTPIMDVKTLADNGKTYMSKVLCSYPEILGSCYSYTPGSVIEFKLSGNGVIVKDALKAKYKVSDSSVLKIYKKNNCWYFKCLKTGTSWITTTYHGYTIQSKITVTSNSLKKGCKHEIKGKHFLNEDTGWAEIYKYSCTKCKGLSHWRQDIGNPIKDPIVDIYYYGIF